MKSSVIFSLLLCCKREVWLGLNHDQPESLRVLVQRALGWLWLGVGWVWLRYDGDLCRLFPAKCSAVLGQTHPARNKDAWVSLGLEAQGDCSTLMLGPWSFPLTILRTGNPIQAQFWSINSTYCIKRGLKFSMAPNWNVCNRFVIQYTHTYQYIPNTYRNTFHSIGL